MPTGRQRTTLYLTVELHERLRRHALDLGTSMSLLIELYAWEGIARDLQDADAAINEGRAPSTSPAARPSPPDE